MAVVVDTAEFVGELDPCEDGGEGRSLVFVVDGDGAGAEG